MTSSMVRSFVLCVCVSVVACTPAIVPVTVTPPEGIAPARVRFTRVVLDAEKAQLTRGATAEGALGTKWLIDARTAFAAATEAAFPQAGAGGGSLAMTVRDFDVEWSARSNGGVAELTVRALAQVEYDYASPTGTQKRGAVVGRGRYVDTGWGPKLDQRLAASIDRVVMEAITGAVADIARDLERE